MKKLLIILLITFPLTAYSKISFACAACPINDLFLQHRNAAVLFRAMLKANGEDWFMKNILLNNHKSLKIYLNFIAGDYCTAGEEDYPERYLGEEFFSGVKKAVEYMSANNDTLYTYYITENFSKDLTWQMRIRGTLPTDSNKYKYNFDGFDYSKQETIDYIRINFYLHPFQVLDENIMKDKINFNQIFKLIEKYKDTRIKDLRDAKTILSARIIADKYILSLPKPSKKRMKILPWSYSAGLHKYKTKIDLKDL